MSKMRDDHAASFPRLVEDALGPVVRPLGFASSASSDDRVRFTDGRVWLELTHEESDGEVALHFGRINKPDERLSFWLYMRSVAGDHAAARADGIAWSGEDVANVLNMIADALKTNGLPILRGDDQTYEYMAEVRWWQFEPRAHRRSSGPDDD